MGGSTKIVLFIIILIFNLPETFSQAPDTLWTRTYGGIQSDVGYCVLQTSDSGYIVAGTTQSFGTGDNDVYLIKTDKNGDTLWTNTFGGVNDDNARSVDITSDNGFVISGSTSSFGSGMSDILLLKTDSLGNTEWYKTYGGSTDEWGYDAEQTFDGGYIVVGDSNWAGYFGASAWIIKTDQLGNTLWSRSEGQCCWDACYFNSVIQLSTGGFVVCGTTIIAEYPFGYSHWFRVWNYSNDGARLWNNIFGDGYDEGVVVRETNDGYILLGGVTSDMYGPTDIRLIKLNSGGYNIVKQRIIGNTQESEYITSLEPTRDNGFIITYTSSLNDFQLLKIDSNFVDLWSKSIGGTQDDRALSVKETIDSGFIITGRTKSFGAGNDDIWLLRLDNMPPPQITVISPNGGEHWLMGESKEINWDSEGVNNVKIELSLHSGLLWYTITEETQSDGSYEWIVQAPQTSWECKIKITDVTDSTISDESDTTFIIDIFPVVNDSSSLSIPTEYALNQNYPNPFNPTTTIKFQIPERSFVSLKVYDVLGNKITTLIDGEKSTGKYTVEFDGSALTSGVYFYKLQAGNFIDVKKMILLK